MKNILYTLIALILAVSCIGGSEFNSSYQLAATFEYNDSVFGKDSLLYDTQYKLGLGWDYLSFYHKIDGSSSEFKGGFLVSALMMPESGNTADLVNNLYRANIKGQKPLKNKYAVFCQTADMPENHLEFMLKSTKNLSGSCAMNNVLVTNTVAVENAVRKSFVAGDQLILRATGYLSGVKTDSADIKLAEFTTSKDSVVTSWTLFDMTKLGIVDKVMFDIVAPDGKDVPLAVCMDNLVANIVIKSE